MLGLLFTLVLVVRKVKGAILIGILGSTVLAIVVEAIAKVGPSFVDGSPTRRAGASTCPTLPDKIVDVPDLSLLGQVQRARLVADAPAGWSR